MIDAIAIGLAGGLIAGLLGLGGGVIFVPGLALLMGLGQHQAEATSLLAIVPVALVGSISHLRSGDANLRAGLIVGCSALGGTAVGVALANSLSGATLRFAFALLLLLVAAQLTRDALRAQRHSSETQTATDPAKLPASSADAS